MRKAHPAWMGVSPPLLAGYDGDMASALSIDDLDLLAALPLSLQTLARRGIARRYRKGSLLIQEGDVGDTLYIVLSGKLRAFSAADNGREITYGIYGPGEYLGEMSLDGGPRSASVATLEASVCVVLTRQSLAAHIAEHPEFAFELLAKVIRRARAVTLSAKQLALNDVYGRLKLLLESLLPAPGAEGSTPEGGGLCERLTHQEIAHRIGCSREMVSRLMKDLEKGGMLQPRPDGLWLPRKLPPRW